MSCIVGISPTGRQLYKQAVLQAVLLCNNGMWLKNELQFSRRLNTLTSSGNTLFLVCSCMSIPIRKVTACLLHMQVETRDLVHAQEIVAALKKNHLNLL